MWSLFDKKKVAVESNLLQKQRNSVKRIFREFFVKKRIFYGILRTVCTRQQQEIFIAIAPILNLENLTCFSLTNLNKSTYQTHSFSLKNRYRTEDRKSKGWILTKLQERKWTSHPFHWHRSKRPIFGINSTSFWPNSNKKASIELSYQVDSKLTKVVKIHRVDQKLHSSKRRSSQASCIFQKVVQEFYFWT